MNLVMRDSLMVSAVAHWLSYHRGVVLALFLVVRGLVLGLCNGESNGCWSSPCVISCHFFLRFSFPFLWLSPVVCVS